MTTAASAPTLLPADAAHDQALLSKVPVGWRRTVIAVDGPDRAELEREGVLVGAVVVVTARTPLGGPLVVEVGRARLALSSRVAGQVATRAYVPADAEGPAGEGEAVGGDAGDDGASGGDTGAWDRVAIAAWDAD